MSSQNLSLLIVAAGMGSRYGGFKQIEGFGPNGETIVDFSLYDAIQAGFNKAVFIIRPEMEDIFKKLFVEKYKGKIDARYVFQTLDMVPDWYKVDPERTKPWGTVHAAIVAKEEFNEPFLFINSDDYYGKESFQLAADFLKNECKEDVYGLIAYRLGNVLSEKGTVKRGICKTDEDGMLLDLEENFELKRESDGSISGVTWDGKPREFTDRSLASMNMFAMHNKSLDILSNEFEEFLKGDIDPLTGEALISVFLDMLLKRGDIKMKVIETPSEWAGVTVPEDADVIKKKFRELIEEGKYPEKLV